MKIVGAPIVLFALLCLPAIAQANPADSIVGTWLTDGGSGKIKIYKCGKNYCGKTVWIKPTSEHPNPANKKDVHNPNPKKRDRKLMGATIMWGLRYDADDNEWIGGSIYDSRKGNVYRCKMHLAGGGKTLKLRGFVGFSLLGQTTTWTRVK